MSSNIRTPRICQHCNTEFEAKTTVTKYCGLVCAQRAYKARTRSGKVNASKTETFRIKTQPIEELKVKEFLTVRDVSKLLTCSIHTAYRLINSGKVKAINLSQRKTLVKRSEIDKLFRIQDQTAPLSLEEYSLKNKTA